MSGPGRIHIFEQRADMARSRLWNFDIDSARLKPEHERWLLQNGVPLLVRGGSLRIIGLTSRSGSANHNHHLSKRRQDAVIEFLRRHSRREFAITRQEAQGEDAARFAGVDDGTEDARWRAVILSVWDRPVPPPPPPVPPPVVHTMRRRSSVKIIMHEGVRTPFMDENDRRAENFYNMGRASSQMAGAAQAIVEERGITIPRSFDVHEIRLTKSRETTRSVGGLLSRVTVTYCDVTYVWGEGRRQARLVNAYSYPTTPMITPIAAHDIDNWLEEPASMVRRVCPAGMVDTWTGA